jgi:CRP-like cAMP-binding protein
LFGFAKAIGRDTYPATAMTASEAIILSWPMQVWDYFVTSYPGFSSETYKIVGERMGELNMRVVEMATQQVEQRVANTLLRLVNQTGRKVEGGIEVDFSITRQDLSEMTATTLHTISRLLSAWEKQGLVKSRRKHIVVSNPQRLVVLGQDHG